jgi:hypothetical protein
MTRPKTLRQAKADYKKYSHRLSDKDLSLCERAAELDRRAEAVRAREKRRRQAQQRREEQQKSEEDARRKIGIGLATQLAGYSNTQKQMRAGMEAFLGLGKVFNNERGIDVGKLQNSGGMQLEEFESVDDCFQEPCDDDESWNNVDLTTAKEPAQNQMRSIATTSPKKDNDNLDEITTGSSSSKELNSFSPPKMAIVSPVILRQNKSPAKISPVKLWEDMLASSTQIAREINTSETPSKSSSSKGLNRSLFDLGLSTQVLQDAFGEDECDDGLQNDQEIVNLQGLPLQSPVRSSLRALQPPDIRVPGAIRAREIRVSLQVLDEALHHEVHHASSSKMESSSPFVINDSSWEAAALKKLMEVEA